jgi:hypothetical protein
MLILPKTRQNLQDRGIAPLKIKTAGEEEVESAKPIGGF